MSNFIDNYILGRIVDYLNNLEKNNVKPPAILEPYLKNGILFEPKSGNIVRILKSNAVFSYFLHKPGYAFLCELFPDFQFNHERERWFIVENPETEKQARKVLDDLEKLEVTVIDDYLKNNPEKTKEDFYTSHYFKNFYTKPPKKIFGSRLLSTEDYEETLTWPIWEKTSKVLFQDLTGQLKIGIRPISFSKIKNGKIIDLHEQLSPYYKANDEIYVVKIKGVRDKDLLETEFDLAITASIENPYIADVEKDDVFNFLYSETLQVVNQVVSNNKCHSTGYEITGDKIEDFDSAKVMEIITESVYSHLTNPKNYCGFSIKSVGFLGDINLGGDDAKKYDDSLKKVFEQKRENERILTELTSKNQKERLEAENKILVEEAKGKAYQKKVALETEADIKRIQELQKLGWDINLDQATKIAEAISNNNGINITNIGDVLNNLLKTNKKKENETN